MSSHVSSDRHGMAAQDGFSLLEALVVVAMIGVTLAVASPRMAAFVSGHRLEGAARGLALELQKVRLRAIAEGRCFQVAFSGGARSYQVLSKAGATPCGSSGFANDGAARPIDDAGAIALAAAASPVFTPRGLAETTTVVTLTAPDGSVRLVAANAAGRVDVQ